MTKKGWSLQRSLSVSEQPLMLRLGANNNFLVSTFSNCFRLMSASGKVEKVLQLPKGIHNISAKPFTSSECLLSADEAVAVTGLRKILYIWSTVSCELIHSFQAHLGRINKMVALTENGSNCMVTSSVDKVREILFQCKPASVPSSIYKTL